jgi:mono/diheme cytochrome c family protein
LRACRDDGEEAQEAGAAIHVSNQPTFVRRPVGGRDTFAPMRRRAVRSLAGVTWVALLVTVGGQEKTVDQGVYTAAQAARGSKVFEAQCVSCHREGGVAPILAGDRFMRTFSDATLQTVYTTIKTTMPRTAPGSLTDNEYTDIVAHLLRLNSYPDGMSELALTDLPGIKIPGQTGNLDLALVQVVGCLSQSGRTWTLGSATDPVRTREPEAAKDEEAAQLDARVLGTRAFRLQQVYGAPAGWTGQKVAIKGFLSKSGAEERVTVTSMRPLSSSCPN